MLKGSLQINNGYWCVSFRIKDKNGKSRQKQLSTGIKAIVNGKQVNKRKAEDKMKEILEQYENTTFESGNTLLCDYVSDWIERDKTRIQSTTYDGYVHMNKKHIEPYFKAKKLKLKDVKPMHLERYYSDKLEEGISPNTIIKHSAIIRTALQDAMKNGLIKTNPADFAEKPKRQKPKHDFYTGEELISMWNVIKGTELELPVYLAMFYGLRRSEAVGLRWSAIDFDDCTLTVRSKVVRKKVNGKTVSVESDVLKSETSNRVFSFKGQRGKVHADYLKSVRERQSAYIRSTKDFVDFVCVNEVGELIQPDHVTHKFSELLETNGLRHIRFHDLRHSCLSLLANDSSFTMKQVQDYAGHADYTLTANTYSHVDTEQKSIELDALTDKLNFKG